MSIEKGTPKDRIELLFKAHYRELCLFGVRFTGNMAVAEDVVQNVFLHFINQNVSFDHIKNPRTYLFTAVRNACIKNVKQKQIRMRVESHANSPDAIHDSMEKTMIEMERTLQIYCAIDSLPHQCKTIFVHCQVDRMKYQEAAEELNISVNSVKTQMKKAYRLLRHKLKDVYSLCVSLTLTLLLHFLDIL